LIEEASIVGQILRGTVYRVEQLLFVPIASGQQSVAPEDAEFVQMI
jgi:hypothetical protein